MWGRLSTTSTRLSATRARRSARTLPAKPAPDDQVVKGRLALVPVGGAGLTPSCRAWASRMPCPLACAGLTLPSGTTFTCVAGKAGPAERRATSVSMSRGAGTWSLCRASTTASIRRCMRCHVRSHDMVSRTASTAVRRRAVPAQGALDRRHERVGRRGNLDEAALAVRGDHVAQGRGDDRHATGEVLRRFGRADKARGGIVARRAGAPRPSLRGTPADWHTP